MHIIPANNNVINTNPNFKSAKDISLKYVLEHHSQHVPKRVLNRIKELISSGHEDLPQLYELHRQVYQPLFEASSLTEAKTLFPEIKDIIDAREFSSNRSKAIKAIKSIMPIESFSLDYIKNIYKMLSQPQLVNLYKFSNRNLVMWLNKKLNIKSFSSIYTKLIAMSNEEENARIAECSRQAILKAPDIQAKRQIKAAQHHRTPEYREKKRQEMVAFYKRNPEVSEKYSKISKLTWDLCPNIKEALKEYTLTCSDFIKKIMSKKRNGTQLSQQEKRILSAYYKTFWDNNPEMKLQYRAARIQAIKIVSQVS